MSDIGKVSVGKLKTIVNDYFRLLRYLRVEKPSLVYFAVSPFGAALFKDVIFYLIIKKMGIHVVFHHHGKGVREHAQKSILHRIIYKKMLYQSDNICLAREVVSDIRAYTKKEPYIIPNATMDFCLSAVPVERRSKKAKILFLSNFIRSKGIMDLLEAAAVMKNQHFNFSISFVGTPLDVSMKELEAKVIELALEDYVEILGPKYGDEKYKTIMEHDFMVFPTFYEKEIFPIVIIEAMQCELPVISTYEGGIPSVINNGINGFLVPSRDIHALADKMAYFIQNPDARKVMGLKAREKYESDFTFEKFEQNLIQIITGILEEIKKK